MDELKLIHIEAKQQEFRIYSVRFNRILSTKYKIYHKVAYSVNRCIPNISKVFDTKLTLFELLCYIFSGKSKQDENKSYSSSMVLRVFHVLFAQFLRSESFCMKN